MIQQRDTPKRPVSHSIAGGPSALAASYDNPPPIIDSSSGNDDNASNYDGDFIESETDFDDWIVLHPVVRATPTTVGEEGAPDTNAVPPPPSPPTTATTKKKKTRTLPRAWLGGPTT